MAFGNSTFTSAASAVSDVMGGFATKAADDMKAKGNDVEGYNYTQAAELADQNEKFTEMSTAVKQVAADRTIYQSLGKTEAEVGGAGFADSGSALDILRDSAHQGSIQKQLIGEQGLITEAGYSEQATAYRNLAGYASMAAAAERSAGSKALRMGEINGAIDAVSAIASLFTGSGGGGGAPVPNMPSYAPDDL